MINNSKKLKYAATTTLKVAMLRPSFRAECDCMKPTDLKFTFEAVDITNDLNA
jgi:hypothetical protein